MSGHGTKFNRKMEVAVAALLTQKNQEEAARVAGISLATLVRWQRLPEFKKAFRKLDGLFTAKPSPGSSRPPARRSRRC